MSKTETFTSTAPGFELQQHSGLRWETVAWCPTNREAQQDFHAMCRIWTDRAHRVVSMDDMRIQIFSDPRIVPFGTPAARVEG